MMLPDDSAVTPTRNTGDHSDDEISFSPRSLMSHIEAYEQSVSDDASLNSDQHSDGLGGLVEVAMEPGMEDELGDGQGSMQSGKSNKTAATASTQSLSQNLSQSFIATLPEHQLEEGTAKELDVPNAPQQHTARKGGYARLSSNFNSFEDDLVLEPGPVVVLGYDMSELSQRTQFILCAGGVFGFSLLYGFLQELISVQILNRQLGLFLSVMQFTGYTVLSYILRTFVNERHDKQQKLQDTNAKLSQIGTALAVPFVTYLGLSLLRAMDLAMTNLAMQYINYPAKTLMKSSRVVFTMIFGVFILRKKYLCMDYIIVFCMVFGLAIFMHADATSSAVFHPFGVIMLTVSLLCDGAITNMSENIMTKYSVGQDEFIFRMYSIALVAITFAAWYTGDLQVGMAWLLQPGTYDEVQQGIPPELASWGVMGKVTVLICFSTMGLLSSSCSAAITKHFGALAMSITSTARKATTVFLSFFLFSNVCTWEHIGGVVIFIAALTAKSLRRKKDSRAALVQTPTETPTMTDASEEVFLLGARSETFPPAKWSIERTPLGPLRRQARAPPKTRGPPTPHGSFGDVESQQELRGTPLGNARNMMKAPSSAIALGESRRPSLSTPPRGAPSPHPTKAS